MDKNLQQFRSLTKLMHDLSKDQRDDAWFFLAGFLESRMGRNAITSKDVCEALIAAITAVTRPKPTIG